MTWNERLRQARTANHITKSEMARKLGVSAPTVTQWESGAIASLSGKNMTNICQLLGVSAEWLLHGTTSRDTLLEPLSREEGQTQYRQEDDPDFVSIRMVKLRLSAGISGFQTEPEYEPHSMLKINRAWVERNGYSIDHLIAIRIRGESMEPSLYDGDVAVVNTAETMPADAAVFAINYEGEAVVKRMMRDAGDWWLTSDNPDHRRFPKKQCRGGECMMVGRVVWREGSRI